jgi:hypothetical protein
MGKLYELLSVQPSLAGQFNKMVLEAQHVFGKRELFEGYTKCLQMFNADRQNEEATEVKAVSYTVEKKLDYLSKFAIDYFDAFLQKEASNQLAKADIVIEDVVIAKDVPACALLGFEDKLLKLRNVLDSIPTLAPGVDWIETDEVGVYKDKNQVVRGKTEKSKQFKEVAPPTTQHKAQVEVWDFDMPVGRYVETKMSGTLTPSRKSQLIGRCDKLIQAVKTARQRANAVETSNQIIGDIFWEYITQ